MGDSTFTIKLPFTLKRSRDCYYPKWQVRAFRFMDTTPTSVPVIIFNKLLFREALALMRLINEAKSYVAISSESLDLEFDYEFATADGKFRKLRIIPSQEIES